MPWRGFTMVEQRWRRAVDRRAHMTFSHDDIDQRIVDLLYGELAGEERAAFDAHVAGCERCRREVESLTGARAAARTVVRAGLDDEPPSALRERILVAARQAAAERAPVEAHAAKSSQASRGAPKWLAWFRGPWSLPTLATVAAMAGFLLVRGTIFREARRPLGEAPEARLTPATEPAPAPANKAEPAPTSPAASVGAESPKADGRPEPEAKAQPAAGKRKAAPVVASGELQRQIGSSAAGSRRHAAAPKAPAQADEKARPAPAKRDIDDFLDRIDPPRVAERRAADAKASGAGTASDGELGGLGTRGQAGRASKGDPGRLDDLLEGAVSRRPAASSGAGPAAGAKPEAPADKPLAKVTVSKSSARPAAAAPAPTIASRALSADLDAQDGKEDGKADRGRGFVQPPPPTAPRAAAPARTPAPPPTAAPSPSPSSSRGNARVADEEAELMLAEQRTEASASRAKKQKAAEKAPAKAPAKAPVKAPVSDDAFASDGAAAPSGGPTAPSAADAVRVLAERAQKLFDAHRWDDAAAAYRDLLRRFPRDTAADAWRKRLATAQSAAAAEKAGFAVPPSR